MKKKMLSAFLCAAMAVTLVAGCGAPAADAGKDKGGDSKKEASEGIPKDEIKVGFVHISDPSDMGYTYNHDLGTKEMQKELGLSDDQIINKYNVPEDAECDTALRELVEAGCNIIFATSFGFEDYVKEVAAEYPDIQFCHATGFQASDSGLDNFHNYFASIYEGRYLAGIAAGLKTETNKLGYVAAHPFAEVISGYTSFFLGARSVCPSVTMDVTFTGSWYDETAEKEAANKLIEGGCVLISQHADSMGAPTACETAGVPNVSYNGSTEAACPNTFLVSSRVNWEPYFEYAIKCVADGTPIDTDWCGTLETGSVELSDLGAAVADGTAEAVEAAKADLIAGKTHVYDITTFTVDGKTLDSYEADIDTDPDYTPDHEVVSDGYFHESDVAFRSAPYFNVRIDGINLLDEQY